MMKTLFDYLNARINSFSFAFQGIKYLIQNEGNAKIHLLATVLVVFFSFIFQINQSEWINIVFAIAFVWAAESFNTAIELSINLVQPTYHPLAKAIKDLTAAGVLIASISAAITGLLIFIPHISKYF